MYIQSGERNAHLYIHPLLGVSVHVCMTDVKSHITDRQRITQAKRRQTPIAEPPPTSREVLPVHEPPH